MKIIFFKSSPLSVYFFFYPLTIFIKIILGISVKGKPFFFLGEDLSTREHKRRKIQHTYPESQKQKKVFLSFLLNNN